MAHIVLVHYRAGLSRLPRDARRFLTRWRTGVLTSAFALAQPLGDLRLAPIARLPLDQSFRFHRCPHGRSLGHPLLERL